MNARRIKMVSMCLALVLMFSVFSMPIVSADEVTTTEPAPDSSQVQTDPSENLDYFAYIESVGDVADATEDIVLNGDAYASETGSGIEAIGEKDGEQNCILWESQKGEVTYKVNVEKDALYNVLLKYLPTGTNNNNVQLGIKIDGEYLYEGMKTLTFKREYKDANEPVVVNGNEILPEQVHTGKFISNYMVDPVGAVNEPFKVKLAAGEHTITLVAVQEAFVLSKVVLKAPENAKTYAELVEEYKKNGYKAYTGAAITTQGEDAAVKSDQSLISKTDNSSCDVTPHDPINTILNYIGYTNWQNPGETITWNIKVPEDGLYTLGFNYKQSAVQDGFSYRWLKIDGETPFEEAKNLRFEYCTKWTEMVFSDDNNNPYQFYLEAGPHTLSLTCTLGEMSDSYIKLKKFVQDMGTMYIKVVMVTGTTPDPDRSYELFKQVPGFQDTMYELYTGLDALSAQLAEISGKRSSQYIAAVNNAANTIRKMYDNPYFAHQYVKEYYTAYTTMSSWLYEMMVMPLSLDQFELCAPETGYESSKPSFFYSVGFEVKRFIASFSPEFDTIAAATEAGDNGEITLWVNWGRDQAMVLSNLIRDDFTAKTGISVNLKIVSASLINGLMAGNFPDLQLHVSRAMPVNYALRGALLDLTTFPDYEEVLKRFQPNASIPFWYKGGLYAIPDTQSFYIMYYRTDVFDQLNLKVPTTWEEFLDVASILQRNNMQAYIPYTKIANAAAADGGIGEKHLFATLLAQHGYDLYNEAENGTNMREGDIISVFTEWTDLYVEYDLEKQLDFYNRFRTGDVPLGIASYPLYTQLKDAAPEIEGRWTIAELPGTVREDGTISNAGCGSGTGACILKASKNQKQAWEFIKWWTSADIQYNYSNSVETILGTVSRTPTANIEALNRLSWNSGDLEVLNAQWAKVEELPEVPGGYYVARAIDQAYWEVLNAKSNSKDAMVKWGEIADNEVIRKISEYED